MWSERSVTPTTTASLNLRSVVVVGQRLEDVMEQTESIPVRTLFAGTIDVLNELLKKSPAKQRDALRRAVATLREALPQAEKAQADSHRADVAAELHLSAGIVEPESTESRVLKAWGADLEQRRKAAGLTRKVLADRAGISESTLRNVETGRRPPTRMTLMHLQSVPELRIDPSPIGDQVTGRPQRVQDFSPNCWLTPEFDALKLHNELTLHLKGRGGHLEQTYLYLDPSSAAAWCAIAEQESYTTARNLMPLGRVAERIAELAGPVGLDVIGLGCGDGKDEVRLTQRFLDLHRSRNLRLYLLDISQPLCSGAYRQAAELLGDRPSVSVYAIQGNFHNLQRYTPLLHAPERSHRRRVVCMFGNTFANLQNEVMFVRNSLIGFAPGDFLLLNVPATMAPADNPAEIVRNDRRLAGQLSTAEKSPQDQHQLDLLRRYIPGIRSIDIRPVLDFDACPVPGSYAADIRATINMTSGETKQFSVLYAKRYDQEQLDCKMCKEGWTPVGHWRYAEEYHPRLLLLYQRARRDDDEK